MNNNLFSDEANDGHHSMMNKFWSDEEDEEAEAEAEVMMWSK